ETFVATRLEHEMDALLVVLSFDAENRPVLDEGRLIPVFRQPYSGHYYQLADEAGRTLRSRSLWDIELPWPAGLGRSLQRDFQDGPQGQRLLVLARRLRVQDHELSVLVAEDFSDLEQGLARLRGVLLLAALALGAVLAPLQYWIVGRGLRPLQALRRDIQCLERGEIERLQAPVPSEVEPLVAELNHVLESGRQRLLRSRNALGNLAHALKTPLTVLGQLAGDCPEPELRDELLRQTRQIGALMERELKRARIAGTAMPGQRVLLARELDDLCATLGMIYRARGLAFEVRADPATAFPGDRDDLLELLGNLLDNACKWARRRVRVSAREEGGWLRLTVEDDGPGCPPEQRELLTRRGVRIDESRAGHGLGLAIVTDIVGQYGGRLRLESSAALGGLAAIVELPAGGMQPSQ
ncbi:MAG TPA: ATP-binding protein, partial [Candidatus Competibacteraceae bacterium]|nr:ATP-binding protein [Candidatus Competibacteraceae bacterium]